jgi:hypothetical protein
MKTRILLTMAVLVTVSLFILTSFNASTESAPDSLYILVEVYEIPSYPDRGVHIHYGNNKREFIQFPGMKVEDHDEAGDITLTAINKLVAEGYQIESTSAGLAQAGMITKIFMRKK